LRIIKTLEVRESLLRAKHNTSKLPPGRTKARKNTSLKAGLLAGEEEFRGLCKTLGAMATAIINTDNYSHHST
jgi:hypothetical protein